MHTPARGLLKDTATQSGCVATRRTCAQVAQMLSSAIAARRPEAQAHSLAGTKAHRRTGAQAHRCTGAQVHRCTGAQADRGTGAQERRRTGAQPRQGYQARCTGLAPK